MRTTWKAQRRFRVPAAFMIAIAAAAAAALASVSAWAQAPAVAPAKQRYVQGSWVNLRESAQSQTRVVAQVPASTVLQQLTERDGWCAVLYAGDARLGPPLPEPLQAHVACNLLADQPLTLAQAAKKLMRGGVLLRPEQEIDRGRPVNPLDDVKLARAVDHIPAVAPLAAPPTLPAIAPSYFRSHTGVALLHEAEADGIAAVAGSRIAVEATAAPYGSFKRHSGPEIEFVTGFWDVGGADLAFAPALTLYAITHQGLVGART